MLSQNATGYVAALFETDANSELSYHAAYAVGAVCPQ
jgi:hypothetical protein